MITMIAAASGTGKSWFTYYIAGSIAHGAHVFGEEAGVEAVQRPVVYLDAENPDFVVQQRLRDLGIKETPNLHVWGGWEKAPLPELDDPELLSFTRANKPVIILDSFIRFFNGDEQSASDVSKFAKKVRRLSHLGGTLIIIHHTGKSESSKRFRGSSDIEGFIDQGWNLVATNTSEGALDTLTVTPFKTRILQKPFTIQLVPNMGFVKIEEDRQKTGDGKLSLFTGEVMAIVHEFPGQSQRWITAQATKRGVPKDRVPQILKNTEIFTYKDGPKGSHLYYILGEEYLGRQITFKEASEAVN
jgi:AAA domain